jgi:hypothetical protein
VVKSPIVADELRLRVVQMADIVFSRILRATRIQQLPHPMLERDRVVAFGISLQLFSKYQPTFESGYQLSSIRTCM